MNNFLPIYFKRNVQTTDIVKSIKVDLELKIVWIFWSVIHTSWQMYLSKYSLFCDTRIRTAMAFLILSRFIKNIYSCHSIVELPILFCSNCQFHCYICFFFGALLSYFLCMLLLLNASWLAWSVVVASHEWRRLNVP